MIYNVIMQHIFHYSGPLHKASALQLKPDQSPQLVPVYTPNGPTDYSKSGWGHYLMRCKPFFMHGLTISNKWQGHNTLTTKTLNVNWKEIWEQLPPGQRFASWCKHWGQTSYFLCSLKFNGHTKGRRTELPDDLHKKPTDLNIQHTYQFLPPP